MASQTVTGAAPAPTLTGAAVPGFDPRPVRDPAAVDRLVGQGAYFSLFSLPNPATPSTPVLLIPWVQLVAIAFSVHEDLHRFEVRELAPSPTCGLRSVQQAELARGVALVSMQMTPMPNYFQPGSGQVPPPTILLPFLSQRFMPLDGSIQFKDAAKSGFTAIGAGRTLPTSGTSPRLCAVIEPEQTTGALAGLQGTGIIIGDIQPPSGFHFNVVFRFVDPDGRLQTTAPLPPLAGAGDPEPGVMFMPLLAERDPERPLQVEFTPDSGTAIIRVAELLRLVEVGFDVGPPGLRSRTVPGAVVGRHSMTLVVNLSTQPTTTVVLPGYSVDGEFSFFDAEGRSIGGFAADLIEARLFPTSVPGLDSTFLRIGGFAPPTTGTGQFTNPVGIVSVNGAFSLATGAVSTLYMVRLSSPEGVFQVAAG